MLTTSQEKTNKQSSLTWLRLFIIVFLVSGIFFRFVNLERKVYWHDEAYTGLRVSGYTKQELTQQVFNGRIIIVDNFKEYQYPNSEKSVIDTIKSLAREDAQHPPLYYLMVRLWLQWFGNSVAVARSLSAIISLVALPCFYWLCIELFNSSIVGWVGIALLSVSPFHVLYAQEARQFSLWTMIIILGSATLLRAMRLQARGRATLPWGIYAVTVALGLYTFLFSGLVTIAHGFYVVLIERLRFTKTVKAFLLAASAGLLGFIPWILVIINSLSQIEKTTLSAQKRQSLSGLVTNWISNMSNLFADFWRYEPYFPDVDIPGLLWGRYLIPFLLILVLFSFYFIYRHTEKRVWLFVFTLCGIPGLTLILHDVILGGKLSARPRYVISCYLGIELAVAYLFGSQIVSSKSYKRQFWQLVMIAVLGIGVLSCTVSYQAETWWSKGSHANPQIARIINQSKKPLLISSTYSLNIGDMMSLSHLLNPNVELQLVSEPTIPKIPDGFSDVFLYNPSPKFKSKIEKEFPIEDLYRRGRLWRLNI
jgi:uncharacterized membrane protein